MASPRRSRSPERQAITNNADSASTAPTAPTAAGAGSQASSVEPWADPSVFASVAARDSSTATPSEQLPPPPTANEGTSPIPNPTINPDNPPRIPWAGSIPAFFQLGPDGRLIPHFPAPPNAAPPQQNTGTSTDAPAPGGAGNGVHPAANTLPQFHFPPLPTDGRFPSFFPFMMPVSGLRDRRPDPEAAAELLRSLPTVEPALFRRVERVIVAEQVQNEEEGDEQGWKCGICLEGRDAEAKETGIKALPCNHLFHGDCLEPWFTTNHTCPTCRLDLDPLKTLRRNRGSNTGRPGATGSGRSTPHPYARPGGATPPQVGIEPGTGPGDGPSFTFIWQMPLPAGAPPSAPAGQGGDGSSGADGTGTGDAGTTSSAPHTPTLRLNFPLPFSASPLPMNRERSASPTTRTHGSPAPTPAVTAPTPPAAGASTETGNTAGAVTGPLDGLPRPQPRRQITVIHHHHPPLVAPGSPHHHHHVHPFPPNSPHHHHHHHLRPPGASTPAPAPATPPAEAPPRAVDETTSATTAEHEGQAVNPASPDSRGPITPTDPPAPQIGASGASNRPHFHFFFNISDQPPGDIPLPRAPGADSAAQPSAPDESPTQPERPSLTEWVNARERSLGWRCDAPDCGIAPSEDDDENMPLCVEGDKEMLSIFSVLQPPATRSLPHAQNGFELHSCEHRWHRSCLESMERSAGRSLRPDGEGRVSVRCEACRKEGWIWPRARSMSEGEVERLCASS